MIGDEKFMAYCIQQAKKAGKYTKTNPMVGSVLVYNGKIIGEGIHEKYGEAHAERNAIDRAIVQHPTLVSQSTLYVTLEPCFHQGNTPPCVKYVLKHKIKKVVIGTVDPNPLVAGKSIALLKENNVEVHVGILEKECNFLIRKFKTNLTNRPYVILKWAQSYDGYMGQKDSQVWLSNKYSKILVHKWRSEVDGIMVGTQTVITDNPLLTTREWPGEHPIRIVPDFKNRISSEAKIFSDEVETLILTDKAEEPLTSHHIKTIIATEHDIQSYWKVIFEAGINSLMVEGGQKLLNSILETSLWDEARVITSPEKLKTGIRAPSVNGVLQHKQTLSDDLVVTILNEGS